jgi:limonene 1,2-monooxygenase
MSIYRPDRLKFGIFLAPFHVVGENPTVAIDRDMELIEHLDRLDYDEAWIGEHHSAGWELIASPELIIAASAQRTRSIRLGTGVSSLPYHHPLILADRMVQLDHMTRGRAMFGVGPGALTSDAYMLGIDAETQRPRMSEALRAIIRLFNGETVTETTDWYTLREARLQLAPYTKPHMEMAVASTFSPAGPMAAGTNGIGVLQVSAFQPGGLIKLASVWDMVEQAAAKAGKTVSRGNWRLVIPIHIADTREQAIADVRDGARKWNREYFEQTLGYAREDPSHNEIDAMMAAGGAIVGTPEDAINAIESMFEMSGGFGGLLGLAHEWASKEATWHSYELLARYVAPRFQGSNERSIANQAWVAGHSDSIFGPRQAAIAKAFADAGIDIPQAQTARMQRGRT